MGIKTNRRPGRWWNCDPGPGQFENAFVEPGVIEFSPVTRHRFCCPRYEYRNTRSVLAEQRWTCKCICVSFGPIVRELSLFALELHIYIYIYMLPTSSNFEGGFLDDQQCDFDDQTLYQYLLPELKTQSAIEKYKLHYFQF